MTTLSGNQEAIDLTNYANWAYKFTQLGADTYIKNKQVKQGQYPSPIPTVGDTVSSFTSTPSGVGAVVSGGNIGLFAVVGVALLLLMGGK